MKKLICTLPIVIWWSETLVEHLGEEGWTAGGGEVEGEAMGAEISVFSSQTLIVVFCGQGQNVEPISPACTWLP